MSSKKLGKGLVLHSQAKEIVSNVCAFMKKEAEEGLTIPLKNFRERILAATGVSRGTYQKICKEAKEVEWQNPSTPNATFKTPPKCRKIKKSKLDSVTSTDIKTVRDIVYDFYIMDKRLPTIQGIWKKVDELGFMKEKLSLSSLRRLLIDNGFRWQKLHDKRKALCESFDIRAKRVAFFKKLIEYRNDGRKIIYTGETYIQSSHVQERSPYDRTSGKGLTVPISKRQHLIIVHAGGENGFINNGLLIFKSDSKTGDHHDGINNENFMNWIENQLLPNLPDRCVLVIDNAAYHNLPIKQNITTSSKKAEMLDWLREKGLPADPLLTKTELYKVILENKHRFPAQYKLDELLERHGHRVLRLPPYHLELNPIEKIWALVKNWVSTQNTTFKLADVEAKIQEVTVQEWFNICQHATKYEDELIRKEHLLDKAMEELTFTVNTGSSDDSWDEEDLSDCDLGCSPIRDSSD